MKYEYPYQELIKKKILEEVEKIEPFAQGSLEFQQGEKIMKEAIIKIIKKVVV